MAYTFKNIQDSVKRKMGASETSGHLSDAVKRAINDAYLDIATSHEWVWAQDQYYFSTVDDLTEDDHSTLAVTDTGNVTLTGSNDGGGNSLEDNGVDDTWIVTDNAVQRPISSVTGNAITLAAGWPDADDITSYHIYKTQFKVAVGSARVNKFIGLYRYDGDDLLGIDQKAPTDFTPRFAMDTEGGEPFWWSVIRHSLLGEPYIALFPFPDDVYAMRVDYYRYPVALSADGDYPIVPERWHHVIEQGALAHLHQDFFHDVAQGARSDALFQRSLARMVKESQVSNRVTCRMGRGHDRVSRLERQMGWWNE